jgi:hypothetical protein
VRTTPTARRGSASPTGPSSASAIAACQQPAAPDDLEVAVAVRTRPLAIERRPDGGQQRLALAVETALEALPAVDPEPREPAVAGRLEGRRAVRQPVPAVAGETDDDVAAADQRAAAAALADRDARLAHLAFGHRHLARRLDPERLVAVDRDQPQRVARQRQFRRAGEPRHRLVAVGVVDEHGVVGLDHHEYAAANVPLAAAAGANDTVAGDGSRRHGDGGRGLLLEVGEANAIELPVGAATAGDR